MVDSLLPERNSWLALKITAFSSGLLTYYKKSLTHSCKHSGKETQRTTNFVISTIGKHGRSITDRNVESEFGGTITWEQNFEDILLSNSP